MKIVHCVFLFLIPGLSGINAQNEMLIGQLSNRLVTRKNFDENKDLLNKQTFKVGAVKETNTFYEIKVITELFDEYGKSTDKYTTTYRCRPDESSIMVMAFPFSNPKSKETKINTTSKNFKELYDLNNLEDVELELSFESGLLDFFGSRSKVKIYNRKLKSGNNMKKIESKLNVIVYAFGLRLKQLEYNVIEKLTPKGLLSFQKFTKADGSYFTMTYE